jgi:Protein of unknown function (DUF2950)
MKSITFNFAFLSLIALLLFLWQGCTTTTKPASAPATEPATQPAQATFDSPDDAVTALVAAARTHDQKLLQTIFGPEGDEILSSGDEVADQNALTTFLDNYDAKHQITIGDNGSMTLVIGEKDWPLPIPIVKDADKNVWYFDTAAGKEEILNRRIGRNELYTIEVCRAIADAQREYAQTDPDGNGVPEYAEKFLSDPGKKNGLYWKTEEGEKPSPLGPLVAAATTQGYSSARDASGEPTPFHGYYYRMLTSQGPNAPDGARDYIVNGKMIGGFGAIAYPAQYGNSGVMTFIVNQDGNVFQRDLGENTADVVKQINSFDPGPDWTKVDPSTGDQN